MITNGTCDYIRAHVHKHTQSHPQTLPTPLLSHPTWKKINAVAFCALLFPPRDVIGSNGSTGIDSLNWHGSQSKPSARRRREGKKQGSHISTKKHDFCLCLASFIAVYFAVISIQSTLHNRSEAEMFAHPNNEGIWRKQKVLLLVRVEGHKQLENTHIKDAGCTWADTLQWTQTHTSRWINTHARETDKSLIRIQTPVSLLFVCLHTQTCTHTQSGASC